MFRSITILLILISLVFSANAQAPDGYYDDAEGKKGEDLRVALYNIIKDHDVQSYNSLWEHFQNTDKKSNGKVWDMYSDGAYEYTFEDDQCGEYNSEEDCYNREHSFPKSWFDDESPMNTDLFHLYPTDGYVNGKRGNNPYGEVDNPSWTSQNGGKLGDCSYPGYSGTVFEPIDEYKGDFARSYFYMLTRYQPNISSWNSDMLSDDNFSDWAKKMLLEWDDADPVSQKETDRNNAVYDIQNNRNPFIDHPEWVDDIWDYHAGIESNTTRNTQIWYSSNTLRWILSKETNNNTIEIYNIVGQNVKNIKIESNTNQIELNLEEGIYFADFKSNKNRTVIKFIVE